MPSSSAPRDAAALRRLPGILFDLDGVLTPTAEVHMRAWATLFSTYLTEHVPGAAPYTDADYFDYVDGKPRYDGVRSMLASRGVTLPEGAPDDAPDADTVCGLGNRKNEVFAAELAQNGVTPYPGSLQFLRAAIASGHQVAVVSSSRNAVPVLAAAGLSSYFEVVVDGEVAAAEGLAGKPAPDTYLDGARRLGLTAADCVVVEDAQSGVQAGRAGAFGLVLGVDRGVGAAALLDFGADFVVTDLDELVGPVSEPLDPTATENRA
ncbi:HAD superfamily hydrolase (TIGR01509 family)/beta-phosphoglucomutase family hydrolase [Frondihabitans sp. PhB188]|uniref:HAD family hydrolase n=1 Tax=Frondihabitans sp. PhB188 TaxID=2485200 RepID=UPI000F490C05|nr:beta-phosphoglucomutase family hydrolase [Frondihabitans sp. PhB188]ROQ39651.1 HAD superfamily hydrolase (TIGR01509 family)/beta-phosphoglucomutase family hydrolase [Frondihabitans sp. PhB188]